MILQNKVPSRKRRKKKEAAPRHRRPKEKEKEKDEVERGRGPQGQIPARQTKVLEAKALQARRSRYAAESGKPAEPASPGASANSGTPQLAGTLPEEAAEQGTPVLTHIGQEALTHPKQTSLPLDLP